MHCNQKPRKSRITKNPEKVENQNNKKKRNTGVGTPVFFM